MVATSSLSGVAPSYAREEGPPKVELRTRAGWQDGWVFHPCWPDSNTNYEATQCASEQFFPQKSYLLTRRGETAVFDMVFSKGPEVVSQRPDAVSVSVFEKAPPPCQDGCPGPKQLAHFTLTPGLRTVWRPSLRDGTYEVLFNASWNRDPRSKQAKSSSWHFGLRVRGAVTTARAETLPKTGVEDQLALGLLLLMAALALARYGRPASL